jgi:hypothetical protein
MSSRLPCTIVTPVALAGSRTSAHFGATFYKLLDNGAADMAGCASHEDGHGCYS